MASSTDEDVKYWKEQFQLLRRAVESANENGLLKKDIAAYQALTDKIAGGTLDLFQESPDTVEAQKKYMLAWHEFNQHVNSEKFWWRFKYCYGGPALLYLLSVFMGILLLWFFFSSRLSDSTFLSVPSWAFLWGALGGIFNGLWWLWQHGWRRDFEKVWYVWYLVLPVMGAILGALVYLVVLAGFIAATGETQVKLQSFVMLLSALAGFSARWAVEILNNLTKIIQIKGA